MKTERASRDSEGGPKEIKGSGYLRRNTKRTKNMVKTEAELRMLLLSANAKKEVL